MIEIIISENDDNDGRPLTIARVDYFTPILTTE